MTFFKVLCIANFCQDCKNNLTMIFFKDLLVRQLTTRNPGSNFCDLMRKKLKKTGKIREQKAVAKSCVFISHNCNCGEAHLLIYLHHTTGLSQIKTERLFNLTVT